MAKTKDKMAMKAQIAGVVLIILAIVSFAIYFAG